MFVSLAVCVLKLTVAQLAERGFNLWSLRLLHHSKLSPAVVARRRDENVHVHIRITSARLQYVLSAAYLDIERLSAAAALLVVLACRDKPARGVVPDGPLPTSPIPAAAAAVPPAPPRSQEAVIWMRSALLGS